MLVFTLAGTDPEQEVFEDKKEQEDDALSRRRSPGKRGKKKRKDKSQEPNAAAEQFGIEETKESEKVSGYERVPNMPTNTCNLF